MSICRPNIAEHAPTIIRLYDTVLVHSLDQSDTLKAFIHKAQETAKFSVRFFSDLIPSSSFDCSGDHSHFSTQFELPVLCEYD